MTAKSDSGVKTVKKRKVRDTSLDKGQTVKKKKKNDRQNPESPKKKQFKVCILNINHIFVLSCSVCLFILNESNLICF